VSQRRTPVATKNQAARGLTQTRGFARKDRPAIVAILLEAGIGPAAPSTTVIGNWALFKVKVEDTGFALQEGNMITVEGRLELICYQEL
tara:strand:- start:73 stop:339 length:267 start_codon:yes stop_codon:yes gene_type:complete